MSMNSPPQFLQDALKDSVTSGSFIDTKFYVFSRRDASGRVGTPRPLYCNGRVLNPVPYLSQLFSDGLLEGQTRDMNEGFPSDCVPYNEDYEYPSDSDLEDEPHCSGEDGGGERSLCNPPDPDPTIEISGTSLRQASGEVEVEHNYHWDGDPVGVGKVAIIRDMAAVTFESMIYFLYTGNIVFAPFKSDPLHELPAEERAGDWSTARIPSPSAKSIYRLADKYGITTLKAQAKVHILNNLTRCNIVDEVFSSFSLSFPEILSVQVSQLVSRIKEESTKGAESDTRIQLRGKIASLTQSQLARATDALAMIWDGVTGLLDLPAPGPSKPVPPTGLTRPLIWHWVIYPLSSSWNRAKLALLRSISTGTFVDVRFYAYNAIRDDLPVDPKPLFASSIVIGEWEPAIVAQTAGICSRDACQADELTDDYEFWNTVLPESQDQHPTESREPVVLVSGAWKTWMSLFSYAHTNEITFAPLQAPGHHRDPVAGSEAQWSQSCSARSMYSLAAALEIENVKEVALKGIQSKLSASNIAQELFTSFAANHKAVMDMEIGFSTQQNPKLVMDHIQKIVSGETPPPSTKLSFIYDKLFERIFEQPVASGSGLGKPTETMEQSAAKPAPTIPAPDSTSGVPLPFDQQVPEPIPLGAIWLECPHCGERAKLRDLHNGLCCPRCPPKRRGRGRSHMRSPPRKVDT